MWYLRSRRLGGATISACGAALALAPGALALGPALPVSLPIPPLPLPPVGGVQTPLPGGIQAPCVPATPPTPETCPAGTTQTQTPTRGSNGASGGRPGSKKVSLSIPRQRMAAVLARGLKVTVRSNAAGVVAVKVTLPARAAKKLHLGRKQLVVGRTSARLAKAGAKTFRVRISRKPKQALARTRSVKLSVSATATGAAAVRRASVRR
jgi:hypothetical protein